MDHNVWAAQCQWDFVSVYIFIYVQLCVVLVEWQSPFAISREWERERAHLLFSCNMFALAITFHLLVLIFAAICIFSLVHTPNSLSFKVCTYFVHFVSQSTWLRSICEIHTFNNIFLSSSFRFRVYVCVCLCSSNAASSCCKSWHKRDKRPSHKGKEMKNNNNNANLYIWHTTIVVYVHIEHIVCPYVY